MEGPIPKNSNISDTMLRISIIEWVDSIIIKDGPDMPIYVVYYKKGNNSDQLTLVHSYLMTPIYMIGYIWVMVIGWGATY